jgi:hypothetical protein
MFDKDSGKETGVKGKAGNDRLTRNCNRNDCIQKSFSWAPWSGSPINLAARTGHVDVIRLLLDHKDINCNIKNNYGYTPLDEVFFNYRWVALRLLAERQGSGR